MFEYVHRVQFYETDLMRIVHHSNYLRFYEEARVAWAHEKGLIEWEKPETASGFAVLGTQVRHLRPARFGDVLRIEVQGRLEGARVVFEYKIWNEEELISEARTEHVSLDENLLPVRPAGHVKKVMREEGAKWKETWLLNL